MNRNELRKADINLMVVFETLMAERNVTRAAEKLCLGQSAVSAALKRLRIMLDDPLFIRVGNTMEPTDRAKTINQILTPALDALAFAVNSSDEFDPALCRKTFHVGLQDDVEYALLPGLLKTLRTEAPDATLVVIRANQFNVGEQLMSGEITAAVCLTQDLPANAKRKLLRRIKPRVLRADVGCPPLTLDEYCTRPHVVVSPVSNISSFADEWLASIHVKRTTFLSVSQFATLPALMEETDLIATLPDYLGMAIQRNGFGTCEPLPFDAPDLELSLTWLSVTDKDPAQVWFREKIQQAVGTGPNRFTYSKVALAPMRPLENTKASSERALVNGF